MRAAFAFHRGNHAEGHFSDPAGRAAGTTKRLDSESSRFALDVPADAPASGGLAAATYVLFAGMIEFGLSIELIEIVTVTDARMGRILRRAGWPLRRVGKARPLGNTTAVAGYLEVSSDALDRIRKAQISGPVLWAPVIQVAA